jgi:multiple sugar transport system ATP-binding protein
LAELALEHVGKVYRNGYEAIHDFSLEIKEGEFLILVGPSGCGKSTLLRMIAGLEDISSGELWVDGEIENYKEPRERNLAMVFQNYALYPNMSVYDNIAFSLSVRKVDKKEIKKKVYDMAKMRVELAALQHAVGTTTIYVTHDQTEAMTLGTRIVVMRDGKMQQVDTPANLYAKSVNRFVAGFIGTPSMNFFEAQVVSWEEAPALLVGEYRMMPCREDAARISRHGSDSVILGMRPENILWEAPECVSAGADYVEAMILEVELLGAEKLLFFLLYGKKYVAKIPAEYAARAGKVRRLYFDVTAIHLFDCDSEMRI